MAASSVGPIPTGLPLTRERLFVGLFLLASLNGFAGLALRALEGATLADAALNLFGISAILWVALAAGLKILGDADGMPLRRGDKWIAALVIAAALLPLPVASSGALTVVSLWGVATAPPNSPLQRASIVFLSVTGSLLWGRLLLALLSEPALNLDASFVAMALGVEQRGNMLWSAATASGVVVAPGCSSLQGMSLALVFWVTVNQFFKVPLSLTAVGWCIAALAATVAVNVARIGSMLRWPEQLEAIHTGWGYALFMWLTLLLVVALVLFGARRHLSDAS